VVEVSGGLESVFDLAMECKWMVITCQ
jgi:hypothetical protein